MIINGLDHAPLIKLERGNEIAMILRDMPGLSHEDAVKMEARCQPKQDDTRILIRYMRANPDHSMEQAYAVCFEP